MKETFNVYGMSCAMCAKKIEDKLSSYEGVSARVLLNDGKVIIDYDPNKYDPAEFKQAIKKLGYKLDVPNKKIENAKFIVSCIITLYFLVLEGGMFLYHLPMVMMNQYLQLGLSSVVIIIYGLSTFKRALMDFKAKSLGMDVLVSIGVISAFALSIYQMFKGGNVYFASPTMILTIVSIGKRIEHKVKHNTAYTVSLLQSKVNNVAHVIETDEDGKENVYDLEAKKVGLGAHLRVLNGEAIPLDGVVLKGSGAVDSSLLTGESKLVEVKAGSNVNAGTLLKEGTIEVIVTKTSEQTVLAKIIEKVEEASSFKPPIERLTSKIANVFVPLVLAIALVSAIIVLFINRDLETSIVRMATVVLVSCPCALGLATPMAILVGSNKAASNGIIFKSGEYLESAKNIDFIFFDKTKTLTTGDMQLVSSTVDKAYISYLVSLESLSNHPIAKAITSYYEDYPTLPVNDFKVLPGMGISGNIEGCEVKIISRDDSDSPNTTIEMVIDGESYGVIELADEIREEAKSLIEELKIKGIGVGLLSGDSESASNACAQNLGIEIVYAKASPIFKGEIVKEFRKNYNVAFVGDGINDAVAMKNANVGFSPLNSTDVSISSSDVILLNDDLSLVAKTIGISKLVYRNIIINLILAFCYNVIAIPLACFGILNPVLSSIMMGLSNIMVVTNSVLIKYKKI